MLHSEALLYRNFAGELGKTRRAGRRYEDWLLGLANSIPECLMTRNNMQGSTVPRFPCHNPARISRLPIRTTCPANPALLHLITITIYGLAYRRSSLHDFLSVVAVPLDYAKQLSQHPILEHPQHITKFHTHIKQQETL